MSVSSFKRATNASGDETSGADGPPLMFVTNVFVTDLYAEMSRPPRMISSHLCLSPPAGVAEGREPRSWCGSE